MGVKSTIFLTRAEAELRYLLLRERLLGKSQIGMTNAQLEDEIEQMNDAINGGEGFENYIIRENHDENI